MQLFLSSEGFGNHADRLTGLIGKGKKAAFIDNAKDAISPNERKAHVDEKRLEFEELGFEFTEIDLRDYFDNSEKLLNMLSNFDLIWFSGGNTFILRRALAQSGLDKILIDFIKADKIVYGGSSAGAIIPTPSLRGTEFGDDPNEAPNGYNKEVIWEGLNLIPFHVVPHYGSDWFGPEAVAMEAYFKKHSLPYKNLSDGQVIVINGNKEEFLE